MDEIWRGKFGREKNKQKFGAADVKFSTDVSLVLEECRVTCMSKFI
jgi:hypothetical protein